MSHRHKLRAVRSRVLCSRFSQRDDKLRTAAVKLDSSNRRHTAGGESRFRMNVQLLPEQFE